MARPSRILALTLVVASLTLPAWGGTFTDLPEGSARSALATILSERGILHGVSETEFGGTEPITRYELANLLNNLLDRRDLPFNVVAWSDIPPGHPAMPAVSRVTSMSLMTGVGGRFEGLRPATRAEFVETLVNLLSYRSVTAPTRRKGGALTFADVPPTTETGKMLDRAANFWQIVEAPGRVRFRPFEPVTRFEALDIVARVAVLTDPSLAEPIREALKLAEALPTPTPERPSPAWTPRVEATPTPVRTPSRRPTPEPTAAPTAAPTPSATRTPFWATPAPTPAPPTPVPTPRRPFWTSPEPSAPPSAAPTREPTHEPSARPSPANRSASLLTTKARVGANLVFYYREGIPADPSMLASAEPRSDLQAVFPGALNLDVGGQYWAGAFGGTGGFSTLAPIAVALPDGGGTSLIDLTAHGEGLMKLPLRVPDFEAAAGAGVLVRLINGGGIEYLTTSKTILGLGPVGQLAARPLPALLLNGAVQLYPLAFQMASVSERSTMAMRLAGAWQLGAEYELMRLSGLPVFASVGYNGLLALMLDGSGLQTLQGLSVGAGGKF